jgi:hypothetical protein
LATASLLAHGNACSLGLAVKESKAPMEAQGGDDVLLLLIHDLGTRWGWVVSVTPRPRFTTLERTRGTHCTGGWVSLRACVDTDDREKNFLPLPGIELRSLGRPVHSQTLYWLRYPGSRVLA